MVFQAHFILSLSQSWNQPIHQETLVPFHREWYLDLVAKCALCCQCVITSRLSLSSKLERKKKKSMNAYYVYYMCIDRYIISVYASVCLSVIHPLKSHEFIRMPSAQSCTTAFIPAFLFPCLQLISSMDKLGFHYSQYAYLFAQSPPKKVFAELLTYTTVKKKPNH